MKKLLIITSILLSSAVSADFFTVSNLKEQCFRDGKYHQGLCLGYIMGIYDGIRLLERNLYDEKYSVCLPNQTQSAELKEVVMELVDSEEMDAMQNSASDIVWQALLQKFPCK